MRATSHVLPSTRGRTRMTEHPAVWVGDATAAGVMVFALMQWLPAVAAAFTIIWTAVRIYETRTVQRLLSKVCSSCVLPKE